MGLRREVWRSRGSTHQDVVCNWGDGRSVEREEALASLPPDRTPANKFAATNAKPPFGGYHATRQPAKAGFVAVGAALAATPLTL